MEAGRALRLSKGMQSLPPARWRREGSTPSAGAFAAAKPGPARGALLLAGVLALGGDAVLRAGDRGDGAYENFLIEADYPDPDVLRAGDTFYFVSSTNHLSPGLALLESKDLVNWRLLPPVIADTGVLSPSLRPERMGGYGGGVWAPSIRRRGDRCFIHFGPGLWVMTADRPEGPWSPPRRMDAKGSMERLIDCCPLWDDDGRAWLVATRTGHWQDYQILLFEMSPDGTALLDEGRLLHRGNVAEANKIYKRDGFYYVMYVQHPEQENRVQFVMRARSLDGPWEHRRLFDWEDPARERRPGQGGLVDTPDGRWFFLCHTNNGINLGRFPVLLPVVWRDGWPVLGADPDGDGVGRMVWQAPKPIAGQEPRWPQSSDDFGAPKLGPQWAFNHAPRADRWSLTERPGFLRLTASRPVGAGGFFGASNTVVQRVMGLRAEAVVRLDISGLQDGAYAGLCHFGRKSFTLGAWQDKGGRRLRFARYAHGKDAAAFDRSETGPELVGDILYLRTRIGGSKAEFAYSLDGRAFTPFGGEVEVARGHWLGNRVGVFCWNETADGAGHIDVDEWCYALARPGGERLESQPTAP